MLTMKDLLVSLLDSLEEISIENAKMQVIIRGLQTAKSLDDLIQETGLNEDTERSIRWMYSEVRRLIQQQADPELALRKVLEQFPRLGGLH